MRSLIIQMADPHLNDTVFPLSVEFILPQYELRRKEERKK